VIGQEIALKFSAPVALVRAYEGEDQSTRMLAMMPADPGAGMIDPTTVQAVTDAAEMSKKDARAYIDAKAAALTALGLTVTTVLADDTPADAILTEARRDPAALVVMCTHGRGGLDRLFFGSVAQDVLHKLQTPLLLIRVQAALKAQRDRGTTEARGSNAQSGGISQMDINIGADVIGSDGKLGQVHRVIVDARTDRVTDLIVKHGFIWGNERVMPLTHVSKVENGAIHVDLDEKHFAILDGFTDDRYRAPDMQYNGPPGFNNTDFLMDVMVAEGSAAGLGQALPPMGFPGGQQLTPDDMSRPAVQPGTPVMDKDGEKIGEVHEFGMAADTGAPTHLTVRSGFLFHSDTTIPVELIAEISDDGIMLNVTKDQVQAHGKSS